MIKSPNIFVHDTRNKPRAKKKEQTLFAAQQRAANHKKHGRCSKNPDRSSVIRLALPGKPLTAAAGRTNGQRSHAACADGTENPNPKEGRVTYCKTLPDSAKIRRVFWCCGMFSRPACMFERIFPKKISAPTSSSPAIMSGAWLYQAKPSVSKFAHICVW